MIDKAFQRRLYLMEAQRLTFGESHALSEYRFEGDNGCVPQLSHARRYARNWPEMRQENIGLLFWGRPGNGKTFAAACIANALIEATDFYVSSVRMTTFGIVLRQLLAKDPREREDYFRELARCDLLILDDFGMERQTEYAREQVFNLIDSRYLARLPLIVTTNLRPCSS